MQIKKKRIQKQSALYAFMCIVNELNLKVKKLYKNAGFFSEKETLSGDGAGCSGYLIAISILSIFLVISVGVNIFWCCLISRLRLRWTAFTQEETDQENNDNHSAAKITFLYYNDHYKIRCKIVTDAYVWF